MAFIGTPLDTRNTFQSLAGKRFNGDGSTTAFTLDVAPSSTLDIEVFVGNVRQDPNSAYTLSGTTLTFTGAPPSGTNNIYVVHQAKSVGTIDPPATETVAKTFSGAVNVTGAFNSVGIDDNGDATTMTIDTSENVNIGDATNRGFGPLQIGNTSDNHAYIQQLSSVAGNIHFGDATSGDARFIGSIVYRHDTDLMKFQTNGAVGLQIDSAGHVTKPLQPSFNVNSATMNNLAINTTHTVQFNSERFDTNADFNTSNYTFTAPVTGKYQLQFQINIEGMDQDTTYYRFILKTSNEDYNTMLVDPDLYDQDGTWHLVTYCILADMDANDVSTVAITVTNDGTAQADVSNRSIFSGFLVC